MQYLKFVVGEGGRRGGEGPGWWSDGHLPWEGAMGWMRGATGARSVFDAVFLHPATTAAP